MDSLLFDSVKSLGAPAAVAFAVAYMYFRSELKEQKNTNSQQTQRIDSLYSKIEAQQKEYSEQSGICKQQCSDKIDRAVSNAYEHNTKAMQVIFESLKTNLDYMKNSQSETKASIVRIHERIDNLFETLKGGRM